MYIMAAVLLQCFLQYWSLATVNTQASFMVLPVHLLDSINQSRSLFFLTTPAIHMDFVTISELVGCLFQQVLAVCLVSESLHNILVAVYSEKQQNMTR